MRFKRVAIGEESATVNTASSKQFGSSPIIPISNGPAGGSISCPVINTSPSMNTSNGTRNSAVASINPQLYEQKSGARAIALAPDFC
jgi:hypothetical protein